MPPGTTAGERALYTAAKRAEESGNVAAAKSSARGLELERGRRGGERPAGVRARDAVGKQCQGPWAGGSDRLRATVRPYRPTNVGHGRARSAAVWEPRPT